jgi:hypothetical protein
MSHIFISYSRRDTDTVNRFVAELTGAGLQVWIDRDDIKVGNTWRVQIVEAIDTCDAFVLILSRNSAVSDNVRKEIDLAQDSGKKIFVLMLDKITIPAELRYQLAGLQFADVPEYGFEASTQGLTKTLKEYLGTLSPTVAPVQLEVEMVIQGMDVASFNKAKQEELLDFLSKLVSTDRSQLQIVNITAGSVHVFVETPPPTAFTLKTMALNHDKRFQEKKITALRLKGNRKFIQISAGILTMAAIAALLRMRWLRILLGSGCFTCLAATGVLAWQALRVPAPVATDFPIQSAMPDTPIVVTHTDTPDALLPVTGITKTSEAPCYIIIDTFAFQGPSRGYPVITYERYEEGDPFIVLMSDRSREWLFGILPDHERGWLHVDWVAPSCLSPAIPTASFIPEVPRAGPRPKSDDTSH